MTTYRRCNSSKHPRDKDRFHLKSAPCPHCGNEPVFNKSLRVAQLNNHLFAAAERGQKEAQWERGYRSSQ